MARSLGNGAKRLIAALVFLNIALIALPSKAEQAKSTRCQQKQAVYQDEDKKYRLRFMTPKGGIGAASNYFIIETNITKIPLEGWVLWEGETPRSTGWITYQCPPGDVTGAELTQCSVWRGTIFSVWPDGEIDLLPPADEPATEAILLPDFGPSLKKSATWKKANLKHMPWDLFSLEACHNNEQ